MRTIIRLSAALLAVLALPGLAQAQEGRLFKNAWFWGVKGGSFVFNSPNWENGFAPVVGAEWLITRSRAGLYVSGQQILNWDGPGGSSIPDPFAASGVKQLYVSDIRSFTIGVLAFPKVIGGTIRPYGGLGFAFLNAFSTGPVLDGTESNAEIEYLNQYIDEGKYFNSLVLIAGVQIQYRRFSVFGQGTMLPQQVGSTWFYNTNHNYLLETGIRWNMGSSIDRPF